MDKYYTPYEEVSKNVDGFGVSISNVLNQAKSALEKKKAEWAARESGDKQIVIDPNKAGNPATTNTAATPIDPSKTNTPQGNTSLLTKATDFIKENPGKTLLGLVALGGIIVLLASDRQSSQRQTPGRHSAIPGLSGLATKRRTKNRKASSKTPSKTRKRRTPAQSKKVRTVNF